MLFNILDNAYFNMHAHYENTHNAMAYHDIPCMFYMLHIHACKGDIMISIDRVAIALYTFKAMM